MLTKEEEGMTKDDWKRNKENGREIDERRKAQKHVYYEEQEREILRVEIFLGHNCPSYLGNRFPKS